MNGTYKVLRPMNGGVMHRESHVPIANDVSATHETGRTDASASSVDGKDETQVCAKTKSTRSLDPLSGRIIGGRFEVRESLGEGGLGRLLAAYDRKAERALSLRVVRCADVASRLGSRVAEVTGLAHPSLLPVIGVLRSPAAASSAEDTGEGSAMIVQGALHGLSLASQLEANRLRGEHAPPEQAYRLVADVAAALGAVHESGPHGAVGPETVWIDDQGQAVLTDLVLSRVVLGPDCLEGEGRAARHTLFLSPEVKCGATPERESDVYALSALFYALVTGRLPDEQSVDPSSLQTGLTRAFDAVLRRGLALQPEDRYPSPDALCVALLESVRDAEMQAKKMASRSVALSDKFSVALLVNVPGNQIAPRVAQPEPAPQVVAHKQVEEVKPAPSLPKAVPAAKPKAVPAANPKAVRPTRATGEKAPVSRAKATPATETPSVSPAKREGVSAKLALVRSKAQTSRATLPPPPSPAPLRATGVRSDRPAHKQEVAALAPPPVSLPPPVPASPVVETPPLRAVDAPALPAVDAPSLPAVDAPSLPVVDELPLAAFDGPSTSAAGTLSLAAMDTFLMPAAAVTTERPRKPSLPAWMTAFVPRFALGWLPSQVAVHDILRDARSALLSASGRVARRCADLEVRRALLSASAQVTRWCSDVVSAQAWKRLDRPTLSLMGAWLVFGLSSIAFLLVRGPAEHGQALLRARAEVAAVERHFDAREAERNLAEQARAEGRVSLEVEVPVLSKRRRVTIESQTVSVAPLSEVKLETLAQMEAHALPGSTVTVYTPDVEALASSLGFRLRRRATLGPIAVEKVELFRAEVSEQDADLELLVASLRERSEEAKQALFGSRKVVNRLSKARLNRAQAKKSFARSTTTRRAPASAQAGRVLRERRKVSQEAQASYEEAAQRAERYAMKPATAPGAAELAAARVTVLLGSEKETFDVPVRVRPVEVSIAPPVGVGFGATHAAFAWAAVKDDTPRAAVLSLASLVPWQTHAIGPMKTLTYLSFGLVCVLSFRMLRPETRRTWATHARTLATAAYERLRMLVARLRKR